MFRKACPFASRGIPFCHLLNVKKGKKILKKGMPLKKGMISTSELYIKINDKLFNNRLLIRYGMV